ncbi:hypothetical protein CRG98_048257 [Punica granatum]|uniref:Protein kinase domain-containing protein n=1 Tax=Punica granatum TaxID=22663 RepID=A0A2I0HI17_PUNGR|nr:hypothetical protein CRG98_048257 [Punica granatum]
MSTIMGVELVFLILLQLEHLATATLSPALAQPNCQESCGKVTIPFPFGVGSQHCFLDGWYEIVCQQNKNGTVPRLKKLDLEVLSISLPDAGKGIIGVGHGGGHIEVNLPIVYSSPNCSRKSGATRAPPNLTGSPFLYSLDRNSFFAVNCGTALINSTASGSVLLGCRSNCKGGRDLNDYGNCSGRDGCCNTTIDSDILQDFSVDFLKPKDRVTTGLDEKCSYGFLADNSWFQPKFIDGLITEGYFPAVIEWGIFRDTKLAVLFDKLYCRNLANDFQGDGALFICSKFAWINIYRGIIRFSCYLGYNGNPYLEDGCQGVGAGLGALLVLLLPWWLHRTIQERREIKLRQKFFKRNGGLILQQQLSSPEVDVEKGKLFNLKELGKATDNFNENRILGKGGQGTVYKGMLTDGRIIAVKKSVAVDEAKLEEFANEVLILSQINHRNVVRLLGCCLEAEVPLLIYEFIPKGTLHHYLHKPTEDFLLSWEARLQIATEVAGALSYLHSSASIPIYHRDIKSSNILLDNKYQAKVADFGISRSVPLEKTHVTTLVRGTFGYFDPEYFQSGQFTDKSDVYSFGVVLVELLTRQTPVCSTRAEEGMNLAMYFMMSMKEERLFDILDPQVSEQGGRKEIMAVADVVKRCLNLKGRKRPTMNEVAMELEEIRKSWSSSAAHNVQQTEDPTQCLDRGKLRDKDGEEIEQEDSPLIVRAN